MEGVGPVPTIKEDHVPFEWNGGPLVLVVGLAKSYGGVFAKGHDRLGAIAAFKRFGGDVKRGLMVITWTEDPGGIHIDPWGNVSWDANVDASEVEHVAGVSAKPKAVKVAKR